MKCKNCKNLGYGYTMKDIICTVDSEPIEDINEEFINCVAYEESEENEDDQTDRYYKMQN